MKYLTLAALLFCTGAHAEFLDGNQLYTRLTSANETDRTNAQWYVLGVHDAARGYVICDPNNVNGQQVIDMTLAALRDHPEGRAISADQIIVKTLQAAFPCRRNPTPNS